MYNDKENYMNFNFKDKNEYIRLLKFAFVGIFNTLVDWIVFFIMDTLLHIPTIISQPTAYACGVICSYIGNKFFTFKAKNKVTVAETVKFVVVNLLSLAASTGVLMLLSQSIGWNEYIAKIPATAAAMCINFIGSRFFVFNKSIDNN